MPMESPDGPERDPRPRAVVAMGRVDLAGKLFSERSWAELARHVRVERGQVLTEFTSPGAKTALADAEVILAGWGCPRVDRAVLDLAPALSAVVMAGGSAAALVDIEALTGRPLALSNAGALNGLPVAEYTLSMILLAARDYWRAEALYRARRAHIDREAEFADAGSFRRVVGIVGASRIGRRVLELLRPFDLDVLLADPVVNPREVAGLGARLVDLDDLLVASSIVSLHVPVLPSTAGMLDARRLALLPAGATLVNTSRGALVDQHALLAELRTGRIRAILDVTDPEEPLSPDHELWDLPNVVLTPHIAGSMGTELRRLGEHLVAEVARFAAGLPFAAAEALPERTPER